MGTVPGFSFFSVPAAVPGTPFDVFPGSPAITDEGTITFKGNYTENGVARTGFWGAWGQATKTVRLYCPTEGNKLRGALCRSEASGGTYDPVKGDWHQEKQVPIDQGIFVHDTVTGHDRLVARTHHDFDDFVFWNFSGRVEGMEEGDDGEPARWRAASFVAVSDGAIAFKARRGAMDGATHVYVAPVDGIYLQRGADAPLEIVADTTLDGETLDPQAAGFPITELGLERDGFRGGKLVVNARMGVEEGAEGESWAGIYLTDLSAR